VISKLLQGKKLSQKFDPVKCQDDMKAIRESLFSSRENLFFLRKSFLAEDTILLVWEKESFVYSSSTKSFLSHYAQR